MKLQLHRSTCRLAPRRLLGVAALGVFALGAGLAGCQSQITHKHDHWTGYYIGPAMSRQFLDYDVESDGSASDWARRTGNDIGFTLRRHLLNDNPENPFHAHYTTMYEHRVRHTTNPQLGK